VKRITRARPAAPAKPRAGSQRLQKVIADRGVASRRHAEELIAAGRVRVNGETVSTLGTKVDLDARIEVDGIATRPGAVRRYVALHKPAGIVSSARAERGRASVTDLVGASERLYPVGRLDVDSEGLVLLTNDGEWAERVLHPRYGHEREYEVTVSGEVTDAAVDRLRRGVPLEEGLARPERITIAGRERGGGRLRVVLRTGWKRQVRRMCSAVGLRVVRLVRVRIGPLALGRLATGTWRELSAREVKALAIPA
jgi:23S rRNA pseudouridine2605 synthase